MKPTTRNYMDKKIKSAWVNALRSGKFNKAEGSLASVDEEGNRTGFCCLGVLCEIRSETYDPNEGLLPDYFAEEVGLDPVIQNCLAHMNDGATDGAITVDSREYFNTMNSQIGSRVRPGKRAKSFQQIADFIEKYL